ncbi:MAG: TRAP transporter large permease [Candidatus Bathyarchaeia archaeon]
MDPILVGIVGSVVMIALFLMGMHVAFAMALIGFLGFSFLSSFKSGISLLCRDIFEQFASYPLSAIPMFMLMGAYAYAAGMGERLYEASQVVFGRLKGGLAIATVMGCAGFAAICGSPTATAAAMGRISIPEMKKYGYPEALATGVVAAGGILGPLIPPSTTLIVYGFLTEQSIGKLFIAGLVPGLILAGLYALSVVVLSKILKLQETAPGRVRYNFKQKFLAILRCADVLLLFLIVILGLYFGFFTPTQAGGIGAAGALAIGIFRGSITRKAFIEATKDALMTSCMVLTIIASAMVFGHFLALTNIPGLLGTWVSRVDLPPLGVLLFTIVIFCIGGCFIDALPLMMLVIPLFYPLILKAGYDPIWFGIVVVVLVGIGVLTPPVGVNVYVVKGIAPEVPIQVIFKGTYPFLIALFTMLFLLLLFPELATWLPSVLSI